MGQDVGANDKRKPTVHARHENAMELFRFFIRHTGQVVLLSHGLPSNDCFLCALTYQWADNRQRVAPYTF